jgi:hypothetical protein
MSSSKRNTLCRNAVVSVALCSASALGQIVEPAAHLEGLPSKWGVDIWQDADLEDKMCVLSNSMPLSDADALISSSCESDSSRAVCRSE